VFLHADKDGGNARHDDHRIEPEEIDEKIQHGVTPNGQALNKHLPSDSIPA
jgi:hypothetical protein